MNDNDHDDNFINYKNSFFLLPKDIVLCAW